MVLDIVAANGLAHAALYQWLAHELYTIASVFASSPVTDQTGEISAMSCVTTSRPLSLPSQVMLPPNLRDSHEAAVATICTAKAR
ncbi:MAG: hypothetical protein AAGU11_07100 [Syntrophobacteraceae bacterium]